jgi:hypothetical protein
MATTNVFNTLEVSVAEDLNGREMSINNPSNSSGPSATADSELLVRNALPFEVYDPVHSPETISLGDVLATGSALELSIWRTVLIITTLAGLAFANSMSIGLITIGLPVIAADLHLAQTLLLW